MKILLRFAKGADRLDESLPTVKRFGESLKKEMSETPFRSTSRVPTIIEFYESFKIYDEQDLPPTARYQYLMQTHSESDIFV